MSVSSGIEWDALFERWKTTFQAVAPLPQSPVNFDSFQVSLDVMAEHYKRQKISVYLDKLKPGLEHVRSFSGALNAIAQVEKGTHITWGVFQVMIECVCKHSNEIDDIINSIADFNKKLPLFQQAILLYPHAKSLQWPVRDLFEAYMKCCLTVVKHVNKKPWKNLIKGLFSSKLKDELAKLRRAMADAEKDFHLRVTQIDREVATDRDIEKNRRLGLLSRGNSSNVQKSSGHGTQSISTITTRSNPYFVGRDAELEAIHTRLNPASRPKTSSAYCVLIHGLGGQGKSQLALAYYHRYRTSYHSSFLLNSETEHELRKSYGEIGKKVRMAEGSRIGSAQSSPDEALSRDVEYAREWLEGTNQNWLLIFDNLEDARLVESYLPENLSGCGSTIITTQKAHMSSIMSANEFHKIALQPLSSDSGSELLLKFLDDRPTVTEEDQETAHEISKWVGGLPLAIVTIGGYIRVTRRKVSQIFGYLMRSSRVWADSGENGVKNYKKTLATVFSLALAELNTNSRHLIDLLAFMNPDHTPEELFTQRHSRQELKFLNDDDELIAISKDLGLRQLVIRHEHPEGPYFSIHRSLQKNILHGLKQEEQKDVSEVGKRQRIFEEVFTMISQLIPPAGRLQQNEKDIWPIYHKYVPQVVSLMKTSRWPDPPLILTLKFAYMLSNVGTFLWHTGQFRDCEIAMREAETILQQQNTDFKESPKYEELLSDIYLVTGILADCIGVSKRRESLEHRKTLLRLREAELERIPKASRTTDDEIRWGNAKGDLACAYLQRDAFDKAEALMEELYTYYCKWGSEEQYPFEYSKYYHHSAFILMADGNTIKALDYARRSIDLEIKHAGLEDDTSVLIAKYDMACLLYNAGELKESLLLHQQVLEKRKELCMETSQYTLESLEAVAIVLHSMGRHTESSDHLAKCLKNSHRATWTEEGFARAQFWHSQVLTALGKHDDARKELASARVAKDNFMRKYPEMFEKNVTSELAIFDRLLPIWIIQSSGKLHEGGRKRTSA